MPKSIENIARALVVHDEKLLVTRCLKKDGGFSHAFLPGGHVEHGETVETTLKREFKEEMGIETIVVGDYVATQENFYGKEENRAHEFNYIFLAKFDGMNSKVPMKSIESHIAFAWCPINDLKSVDLKPEALIKEIPAWINGRSLGIWCSR